MLNKPSNDGSKLANACRSGVEQVAKLVAKGIVHRSVMRCGSYVCNWGVSRQAAFRPDTRRSAFR